MKLGPEMETRLGSGKEEVPLDWRKLSIRDFAGRSPVISALVQGITILSSTTDQAL